MKKVSLLAQPSKKSKKFKKKLFSVFFNDTEQKVTSVPSILWKRTSKKESIFSPTLLKQIQIFQKQN